MVGPSACPRRAASHMRTASPATEGATCAATVAVENQTVSAPSRPASPMPRSATHQRTPPSSGMARNAAPASASPEADAPARLWPMPAMSTRLTIAASTIALSASFAAIPIQRRPGRLGLSMPSPPETVTAGSTRTKFRS